MLLVKCKVRMLAPNGRSLSVSAACKVFIMLQKMSGAIAPFTLWLGISIKGVSHTCMQHAAVTIICQTYNVSRCKVSETYPLTHGQSLWWAI